MRSRSSLFLLLLLLILPYPTVASAHAELVTADPPPGAQLSASPAQIRLTFSEPLQPVSTITLSASGFREIPGLTVEIDPQSNDQLLAAVPALDPGVYTVQWTAITKDGHETSGSYMFSLEQAGGRSGWWAAAVAGAGSLLLAGWAWRRREMVKPASRKGKVLKIGLPLLVVVSGVGGFFTLRHWNATQHSPEAVTLDYVRSVYARDYNRAWGLISAEDKQFKTRQAYLAENTSFSGLRQDLSYQLAGWIQFTEVKTEMVGDRATVTVHILAPNGNQPEVYAILEAAERETELSAIGKRLLFEQLADLHAASGIEFLEGEQSFTLVREAGSWRMGVGWAEAIVVKLTAGVSPDLDWEFYPLQAEVRALPGERLTVTYRARNQSDQTVTAKAKHFVLPEEYRKYYHTVQCFCFIQQTLAPGEVQDMTLVFWIDYDVPVQVHEIENRYVYYTLDAFPGE